MTTSHSSDKGLSARDWFGVAVRCAGLVCFYNAMSYFLYFVDARLGLSDAFGGVEPQVPTGYLTYVAAYSITGVFLLKTADSVVRFAYDHDDGSETTDG